jgi:hypothetical protein
MQCVNLRHLFDGIGRRQTAICQNKYSKLSAYHPHLPEAQIRFLPPVPLDPTTYPETTEEQVM